MKRLLAIVILIIAVVAASFSPLVHINDVVNKNDYSATARDIAWLKQQNWLWRSTDWLAQNLPSAMSYEQISISKNNILSVEISGVARTPFIAVKSGGYFVIIDRFGIVLDLGATPTAPYVIEGFNVKSAVVGKPLVADEMKLIEHAVQIVYMFKKNTDYLPAIRLEDKHIIQQMSEDIYIDFGRGDDVELQFNNALVAYQNMIDNHATSGVVNVSNPEQCIIEPLKR